MYLSSHAPLATSFSFSALSFPACIAPATIQGQSLEKNSNPAPAARYKLDSVKMAAIAGEELSRKKGIQGNNRKSLSASDEHHRRARENRTK
jgi:hypothetical protein